MPLFRHIGDRCAVGIGTMRRDAYSGCQARLGIVCTAGWFDGYGACNRHDSHSTVERHDAAVGCRRNALAAVRVSRRADAGIRYRIAIPLRHSVLVRRCLRLKPCLDKKLSPNALDELCAAARNISDIRVDKVTVFPYTEYQILRKEARRMSYLYFAAGSILVQGTGLSVLRARKRG